MKELLQSVFRTTEERVKNPFIGAFITSWVLFNWKPILFILFSAKNIEEKITFINENFSDLKLLIWFPLLAVFFYILLLPYLNLLFDILLKYSLFKRNEIVINKQKQIIDNQKQIAIEEIKLEEAKTEYRERNTHNKLVEDLQKRNIDLESEFNKEKELSRAFIEGLRNELKDREKKMKEEFTYFEKRYSESQKIISELNKKIIDRDKDIQSLQTMISDKEVGRKLKL